MMNIYIHLLSAAGLALSVAGCDQSSTIGTGSSQSELSSLALLVDGSSKLARNYFTGRCGPLTVSYYSAERYPMAEATPGNEAAKKYAWFGIASIQAAEDGEDLQVEYLQSRGEGTFAMEGRQRDEAGRWQNMRTATPDIGPDRITAPRWLMLDESKLNEGAPFTWVFLANVVAPEARLGPYEFRPAEPEVFRINGTQTCEIMPDFARITITP